MRKPFLLAASVTAMSLMLGGCASNLTGDSYSRDEARTVQNVRLGTIEYLRPANGSKIYCTATPKKLGRTLSVVALEMTNDQGAVVATATYTFFMMH